MSFIFNLWVLLSGFSFSENLYTTPVDISHLTEAATYFCNHSEYLSDKNIRCGEVRVFETSQDVKNAVLSVEFHLTLDNKWDRKIRVSESKGNVQSAVGIYSKKVIWTCKISSRSLTFYATLNAGDVYRPSLVFDQTLKNCIDFVGGPHESIR